MSSHSEDESSSESDSSNGVNNSQINSASNPATKKRGRPILTPLDDYKDLIVKLCMYMAIYALALLLIISGNL